MLEIDLTFKGERGDTLYNYWANRTDIKLDLLIQIDANNSLRFQMNQVKVKGDSGDNEVFDGIDHRVGLPLRVDYDATDASPFIITGKNTLAAYLLTGSQRRRIHGES